uniref:Uncharacterized protein n=1 Tax=Vespula pensylvanica TaxID=30213 RepID=A0A834P9R4_VESPE|nr:hypothetical protein H0235_005174 [Vespula pensylvanica]
MLDVYFMSVAFTIAEKKPFGNWCMKANTLISQTNMLPIFGGKGGKGPTKQQRENWIARSDSNVPPPLPLFFLLLETIPPPSEAIVGFIPAFCRVTLFNELPSVVRTGGLGETEVLAYSEKGGKRAEREITSTREEHQGCEFTDFQIDENKAAVGTDFILVDE